MYTWLLRDMAEMLVEVAKAESLITYGDLSFRIEQRHGVQINPRNLDSSLGRISDTAQDNDFPKISALVVNKENMMPGDGFFKGFAGGIARDGWIAFWVKEVRAIYEVEDWDELLELL